MPASRSKTKRRPAVQQKSRSTQANNAVRRKKRMVRRSAEKTGWTALLGARRPARLPGWKELTAGNERSSARRPLGALAGKVSTMQFAMLVLVLAGAVTLYVGHVQATQDLLAEVQHARRENQRLHLKLDRLRGEFDRATGPAVVYRRARALGLEEGIVYGPTIQSPHND